VSMLFFILSSTEPFSEHAVFGVFFRTRAKHIFLLASSKG